MTGNPPLDVQEAAAKVDAWLAEQAKAIATPEQIKAMTPAQRLDYSRRWPTDPDKLPPWRDPRG
jgi:hypothetical protein